MKFFDFFAGIGGFRLGMEMAGHKCVGHCEIDKWAQASYRAMYPESESEVFFEDVRTIEPGDMPDADCYCFGFPCQSFSIAGKRGGFNDTRGTLFFEVMRLAKERKPAILLGENVKGLLSHEGGRTFETIINTMDQLGYLVEWQLVNSKYFGVPQNRERVIIIGHFRERSIKPVLPIRSSDKEANVIQGHETRIIANTITGKSMSRIANGVYPTSEGGCYESTDSTSGEVKVIGGIGEKKSNGGSQWYWQDRIYDTDGISPALNLESGRMNIMQVNKQAPHIQDRIYDAQGISPTLNTNGGGNREPKVVDGIRIRKLTPRECFRLQGFPDEYFDRAASVCSDSQLYKQAGNAVTVPVVYEIAKRLEV